MFGTAWHSMVRRNWPQAACAVPSSLDGESRSDSGMRYGRATQQVSLHGGCLALVHRFGSAGILWLSPQAACTQDFACKVQQCIIPQAFWC
jgi:hypothetical protein